MKSVYLLCISILWSVCLFSQVPSDCSTPPILKSDYETDVIDLAFNRMYEINSPDTVHIEIPTIYQDTIWHGLSAIFNTLTIPERDSIFNIYCIHRNQSYYTISKSISVKIDPSYSWTNAWLNLTTTTGYNELDNFIAKYGFKIDRINKLNFADLSTDQIINTRAFCDSLKTFEGIVLAETNDYGGGGDCISYKKIGNEQFYDFSIGWGDCWSGCINSYIWHFNVNYNDCSVEYLGNEAYLYSDNSLPEPVNCYITSIEPLSRKNKMDINLYPNPTLGILNIEANDIKQVDIFTITGIHLKKIKCNERNEVNLNGISSGIYLVKIITEEGIAVERIIVN